MKMQVYYAGLLFHLVTFSEYIFLVEHIFPYIYISYIFWEIAVFKTFEQILEKHMSGTAIDLKFC